MPSCKKCMVQGVECFYEDNRARTRYQSSCKLCVKSYQLHN